MRIVGIRILVRLIAVSLLFIGKTAKADETELSKKPDMELKAKDNDIVLSTGENDGYIDAVSKEEAEKIEDKPDFSEKKISLLPKGKFVINASAYTASADECGKSDGITASGEEVKEKETIACPRQFPFGTKLHIDGFGTYICQDRGGAIKGNKVDIYMKTKSEAFAFGRRKLLAEVVE